MMGFSEPRSGLPDARLHIVFHGFAFCKVAKPDDEHDLQAFPTPSQACFAIQKIISLTLTTPNTAGILHKLVTVFAFVTAFMTDHY